MVNPGLSFEQSMMGLSPECYIPSFMETGPLVFTIYGHGSHLDHVTNTILIDFNFLVSKSLYTKFVLNGPVISEKSKF